MKDELIIEIEGGYCHLQIYPDDGMIAICGQVDPSGENAPSHGEWERYMKDEDDMIDNDILEFVENNAVLEKAEYAHHLDTFLSVVHADRIVKHSIEFEDDDTTVFIVLHY